MGPRSRRDFLALAAASGSSPSLQPILVTVHLIFDQGAHSGKGLTAAELARFDRLQDRARREFAISGIFFQLRVMEGGYLRAQGYSEIPDKFLDRAAINVFVTETLGYDIDRDRTGGCAIGPRPRRALSPADPHYKIFIGLREASEATLPHEYAHHFTLDTQRNPTSSGNFWADLRNDYWLWRQRRGVPVTEFRACLRSPWARVVDTIHG